VTMYEFNPSENEAIRTTAKWIQVLGVINSVLALIQLCNGVQGIISASIYGATAWVLLGAARALRKVVETEGEDITHLMTGLDGLSTLFSLRLWLMVTSLVLAGLGLVVLILVMVFSVVS